MADKLKSRKFWFAFLGALLPIVAQGLTGEVGWAEAVTSSIILLSAYMLGQGYVDGQAAKALNGDKKS